jgi:MFS family permease
MESESPSAPVHRSPRRGYWWVLTAGGTSAVGDGLVFVALPLLAVTLTHQPVLVAGVAVAAKLPWLLVSLPAGALADRVDRRRLAVAVEVLRAGVLAGLGVTVLVGHVSLAAIYLVAFTTGALETAFAAATRASLPHLVDPADVPRANSYLYAAETAGEQFAGPALGGVLFSVARSVPFLADAGSFAGSAVMLGVGLPREGPARHRSGGLAQDVRVGLRWFRRHPPLQLLAVVIATFAFCQAAVLSVLVLYGQNVLHLSPSGYGLFLAVGATGDVLGSLTAHRVYRRLRAARAILGAGAAAGAGYVVLAATSTPAVAVVGYALEAVGVALGNVATMSLRYQIIPSDLFGRVNNTFRTAVLSAGLAGALAGGVVTEHSSLHATFLSAGVIQLGLVALLGGRLARDLSRLPA